MVALSKLPYQEQTKSTSSSYLHYFQILKLLLNLPSSNNKFGSILLSATATVISLFDDFEVFVDFNIFPVEIPATQNQDVDATNAGINEEQLAPRVILPQYLRISEDAKQTLQVCVSAFIRFITNKPNERCEQDCRITVTSYDILWAVRNLGFNDYVEPLTTFLSRLRESEGGYYTAHGLNTLAPQQLQTLPPMSQPLVPPSQGHFLLDPNLNMMGGSFHSGGLGENTLSNAPINDNLSNQHET
ncbi:nuclear transcription factor Y subunit B-9 [Senna tora]|uniref:Nuclear transcription factor Y subunit B-9 n=1 Tax=Senna tora TaxID=362788 RepID=A0A834WV83_9FABA|nr:nuclear transcription factor Y subunit B-9 [Senna tora]